MHTYTYTKSYERLEGIYCKLSMGSEIMVIFFLFYFSFFTVTTVNFCNNRTTKILRGIEGGGEMIVL